MSTAHIVKIRRAGQVAGFQLRVPAGVPFRSMYFACHAHGGEGHALSEARATAANEGLVIGSGRGGSPQGRRTSRSRTPAAGVRFEWRQAYGSAVLYVVASWPDNTGRPRQTAYSTELHGLEGALDKAIAKRTSCGAPDVDKAALLRALRREKRTMQGIT